MNMTMVKPFTSMISALTFCVMSLVILFLYGCTLRQVQDDMRQQEKSIKLQYKGADGWLDLEGNALSCEAPLRIEISGYNCDSDNFSELKVLLKMNNIERVAMRNCNLGDKEGMLLNGLKNLTHLELIGCNLPSALYRITNRLEGLRLIDCLISDLDLRLLGGSASLKHLGLSAMACFSFSIDLSKFPNLKHLELLGFTTKNSVISNIVGLEHLECLVLYAFPLIMDNDLSELADMPSLKSLYLFSGRITDEGLQNISKSTTINGLTLYGCHKITNAGLQYLSKMNQLKSLSIISNSEITDRGIEELVKLKYLKILCLAGCTLITKKSLEIFTNIQSLKQLTICDCREIKAEDINNLKTLIGNISITDSLLLFPERR